MEKGYRLGIDLGNVTLKLVVLDDELSVCLAEYIFHRGKPLDLLKELLERIKPRFEIERVGITGSLVHLLSSRLKLRAVDLVRAEMSWVKRQISQVRNILDLGGSSVSLIELDEQGRFKNYTTNAICAAGTGSFLDEQAERLQIGYQDLAELEEVSEPPPVAARCSVFAKSDLIHLQQEGYSRDQLWSGLCRSLCRTLLHTLLKGRTLTGLTAVVGGMSLNQEVLRWLKFFYPEQIQTFPMAHLSGALGAGLLAPPVPLKELDFNWEKLNRRKTYELRPPLVLKKSQYPDFKVEEEWVDELGNEVRISFLPEEKSFSGFLGIDIGSTSTKMALIDEQGQVLVDIYRRTLGEPIPATLKLFRTLKELLEKREKELLVKGVATTGSGRKLVGMVVGADLIVNEITCHYWGAKHWDSEVETIFEIGGQDSKYIFIQDGKLRQTNLNYVCAAGTGSFVEELAHKLGFKITELGEKLIGIQPPYTSDRCTVFMEQDVAHLLQEGFTREEAMSAVLYSVAQNYLNKVVGNRPRSKDKIFFQGATARNKALVAAFENLLGVEVVVSPYCHILGALGAALLAQEKYQQEGYQTKFRGLELTERKIELRKETCKLCENQCQITYARIEGEDEEPSWGYMCGREPTETKKRQLVEYKFFRERVRLFARKGKVSVKNPRGRIGIPLALTGHNFMPMWRRFFAELGYLVQETPTTTAEIKQMGINYSAGDFCFPMISAYGHIRKLLQEKELDFIFLPHMISYHPNPYTSNSFFCPYVQAFPSVIASNLRINQESEQVLLRAVVDFRWEESKQIKELYQKLGEKLGVSRKQIAQAWQKAVSEQEEFERELEELGKKALKEIEEKNQPAIVILGRPYNIYDPGISLGLPQKIAELGFYVIPLDLLGFHPERLGEEFSNLYWNYGQRIIYAVKIIRSHPQLFALYFSNFNCGPDSFLIQYVEELLGDKPMLALEFDEHGADAGYMTRVEAFLDVIKNLGTYTASPQIYLPRETEQEFKKRKIYVPPMGEFAPRLGVSAFRYFGYQAEVLPLETQESLELGRSVSRGSECLPTSCTIGTLLKTLKEREEDPSKTAFFMATACGPCRFGQYRLLHRLILNRKGYKELLILSPSSINSYQGLPEPLRKKLWDCFVIGDLLFKAGCKLRPYEQEPGLVDRILEESVQELEQAFEKGKGVEQSFERAVRRLSSVPVRFTPKPLVGVVGEIYVRANAFANDWLIRQIEEFGGEAWLAPLSEWFFYTTFLQRYRSREGYRNFWAKGTSILKNRFLKKVEEKYFEIAEELLSDRKEPEIEEVVFAGARYLPLNFEGEAILTVGRAIKFIEQGAGLVVNCAPFGCMPGTSSSAIFQELSSIYQVSLVSIFYDGKPGLNQRLRVLIENLAQEMGRG